MAGPIRKSAPSCSCPRAQSNGTCARYTPSSASAPATNCTLRSHGLGMTARRPRGGISHGWRLSGVLGPTARSVRGKEFQLPNERWSCGPRVGLLLAEGDVGDVDGDGDEIPDRGAVG